MDEKRDGSPDALKRRLSEEQYHVTQEAGTEPPFTGKYYAHKAPGEYLCVCCGSKLFSSQQKYESGTGWPSFWQPIDDGAVEMRTDTSYGMVRTEVVCANCGAHLGHVFPDGPQPTGTRYCMNSASLRLDRDASATADSADEAGEE